MKGQKKVVLQTISVLFASALLITTTVINSFGDHQPVLKVRGQHVSIHAANATVEALLDSLVRESGIEVFVQGRIDGRITTHMENVPLEDGIRRLLKGYNHAFTYGASVSGRNVVITRIYVYAPTNSGEMTPINPAAAIKETFPVKRRPADGIVVHAQTSWEGDSLAGMQAIDPLMRINQANAPYLPENFHTAENSLPAPIP